MPVPPQALAPLGLGWIAPALPDEVTLERRGPAACEARSLPALSEPEPHQARPDQPDQQAAGAQPDAEVLLAGAVA